jgi:hypothetical protein
MTSEEFKALQASWPECDFWDVDDTAEELSNREVLDAIEHAIDGRFTKGQSTEECIKQHWPDGITLFGWSRKVVSESDIQQLTAAAVEAVLRSWCEDLEMGDPDGEDDDKGELPTLFEAAIRKDLEKRTVWACDQDTEIELTFEQLWDIIKLEFSHWVEDDEKLKEVSL